MSEAKIILKLRRLSWLIAIKEERIRKYEEVCRTQAKHRPR
jgi:hypothetical protein